MWKAKFVLRGIRKFSLVQSLLFVLFLLQSVVSYGQCFYQCEDNEKPDVKVWAAENAEEADVWVYFVYDASEVKGGGVLMQVANVSDAAFSLSFVDVKSEADFSLWIVDFKEEAGWRNAEKRERYSKYIKDK